MRIVQTIIAICMFISAINACAFLPGAWFNTETCPYDIPYTSYCFTPAEIEAILENGDVYRGTVIIYEQGLHLVYGDKRRTFVKLEAGLEISKKNRDKIELTLPGGDVIVGKAASKINGERLFLREDSPPPYRCFVLIFSNKFNYEPSIPEIKSLKIISVNGPATDDSAGIFDK
ncbi:MAG: hypothetical protein GY771_06240 [bacterium]|nr:hypothetical protein [bacterium]